MRQHRTKAEIQAELEQAHARIAELESAASAYGRAEAAQRESEHRLRVMLEISQAMSASFELGAVLQKIVENAVGVLKLDSGAIYTLEGDELYLEATTPPLPPGFPDELRRARVTEHPHISAAIASGITVILPDTIATELSDAERVAAASRGLRSIAYIPLMISDRAIGVLIIASVHRLRTFTDEEIALYTGFAGQAAQTIENVRMYELARQHAAELKAQVAERKQAEEKLRASEQKYRDLVNGMNDTVWVIDFDTTIMDVNDAATRVLGYTREELLSMTVSDIDAGINPEQIRQLVVSISGDQIQVFETRHTAKDASIIPVEVSSSLVSYREKTAILSIARDITERKRAEEQLREREELLRVMGRTAHVGGWDFDTATGEGHWTEEVARIHDLDPATQPNKDMGLSFYSSESKPRIAAAVQDAIDHATSYDLELEIVSATGVHKWVRTIGHPVVEDGQVVKLRGSFQDITDLKLAETQLANTERRFRALIEHAPDGIVLVGMDGKIAYASPSVTRLFGYTQAEALTSDPNELTHPEDRPTVLTKIAALIENPAYTPTVEYRFLHKNGEWRWIESTFSNLLSLPNVEGIAINFRDIHERKRTEAALREGEERFRTVADFTYDLEYWLDENGALLYISPSCARLTGYERAAFMCDSTLLGTIIHPDDIPLYDQHLAEEFRTPAPGSFDFRIITADGRERWVNHTCQGVYREDGKSRGRRVSVRDITERRQAIEELRASEARYRQLAEELEARVQQRTAEVQDLYDNAPTGYHSLDANGHFVIVNQTELDWLGYTHAEMIGRPALEFLTQESRNILREKFAALMQRGGMKDIELEFVRKDGSVLPVSLSATAIRDEAGHFVMSRSTLFDITERKRAENELKRNVNFTNALLDSIPTPVFYKDKEGRYLGCNRAFAELTGKPAEAIMSKLPHEIWPAEPADVYRHKDLELLQSAKIQVYEATINDKNGHIRSVIFAKNVFLDESGRIAGLVGAFIDITERKRAEETLRQANVTLERAMRVKDEFLATMSHELRTPLTGILGLSESLQMGILGALNARQMKAAKNIEESGRHLLELINDVLDLSKIEADRLELQIEHCALEEICQASLHLTKGMAQQRRQRVYYTAPATPIILEMDARRIKQVLVNLFSNAIKFTPENGELGLIVEHDEPNRQVRLIVWDKGIGIIPEHLPKLFQPFTQIDSSLAREYSGTGLGLALVRRLVELHNGTVAVESVFGEGSRFIVTLPWTPQTARSCAPEVGAEELQPAAVDQGRSSPMILITDDNLLMLELLTDFLEAQGCRTAKTQSGKELLSKIKIIKPDVVLMDIQMPGMDGLETIRRIRHHEDAGIAATKIIAVTALVMLGDRERCLEAGANEYMSKPLNLKKLIAVIQNLTSSPA